MSLQDVASMPSQASTRTRFNKNCGRGQGLGTGTSLKTVVGGIQDHAAIT